ncbi:MAG: TonB-dependent receptor plug domain-containing protein, partial [Flavobacteriales bacterium]|nr:TonB-dependent receptor plug domain-containing protein [Flavobacteriales bacterium]
MRSHFKFLIFCFAALVVSTSLQAQPRQVSVNGLVKDKNSSEPVPYATVVIHDATTNEIRTGTTTQEDGRFSIRTKNARIYVSVSFIGYLTDTIRDLKMNNGIIDLGTIAIEADQELLDEVVVVGEKSRTEFKLDKRVFNVGKDISTSGASAMEVLDKVPSVEVDIEGTVKLRGSSGVQILIDGKPSVASDDPATALGTITADMIESIEVITNPSAKYDAEGTSGILNIVLKKNEKKGLNGSVSINTGIPDNHSIGISLNRRSQKFNLFTQLGAGYRSLPRYSETTTNDLSEGTSLFSESLAFRNEQFYNITLGTDYHINDRNVITLSGRFAYEIEKQPSESSYSLIGASDALAWTRTEVTEATNPKLRYDINYKREFK